MNLFVYFSTPPQASVLPENEKWLQKGICQLRAININYKRQSLLISELAKSLNDPSLDGETVWKQFEERLTKFHEGRQVEWMDFPIIVFLYAGLYLGLYNCVIEPLFTGQPIRQVCFGIGMILQIITFYTICKVVMILLENKIEIWKQVVIFTVLLSVYLGVNSCVPILSVSMKVPVWLWIVFLGASAWITYRWHIKNFYHVRKWG